MRNWIKGSCRNSKIIWPRSKFNYGIMLNCFYWHWVDNILKICNISTDLMLLKNILLITLFNYKRFLIMKFHFETKLRVLKPKTLKNVHSMNKAEHNFCVSRVVLLYMFHFVLNCQSAHSLLLAYLSLGRRVATLSGLIRLGEEIGSILSCYKMVVLASFPKIFNWSIIDVSTFF